MLGTCPAKTQRTYADAARAVTRDLADAGGPTDAVDLAREHLVKFIGYLTRDEAAITPG